MRLYDALAERLPEGWTAWHSLRTRSPEGIAGEGDFVVAVPGRGMLVIEVKGGRVEVRDGRWFQSDRELKESPRAQGERFVRMLVDRLAEQRCRAPAFGVATCFPDVSFERDPGQDDLAGRVLGAQDLPWLGDALRAVVDRALPPARPGLGDWIGALHRMWGESWTPKLSLGHRARIEDERRARLDADQLELLWGLSDNPTVLVEGGAGTGKTSLAREVALRLAGEGKRVALLCFTTPLARWLRDSTPEGVLRVDTVRGLALALVREAGLGAGAPSDASGWEETTLRAALDAIPALGARYDAVVIDEAQDFAEADWAVVDELSHGGVRWAFHDPSQAFWPDRTIPRDRFATRYRLRRDYRCPPGIQALAGAYVGREADPALIRDAVDRGSLSVVTAPTPGAVRQQLETEVEKLLSERLRPEDIAILSLRGRTHPESLTRLDRLGRHALVSADSAEMSEGIVADSFLRFKGLERPAVLVVDLGMVDPAERAVRMHVALTRAMLTARIVAAREEVRADPVLSGLGLTDG
jgi:hypothetical protein